LAIKSAGKSRTSQKNLPEDPVVIVQDITVSGGAAILARSAALYVPGLNGWPGPPLQAGRRLS
jgi:hypothetical protein